MQAFIVNMKKEESDLRQQRRREKNPTGEAKNDKTHIVKKLEYADPEKEMVGHLSLRMPRRTLANDDAEHEQWKKVLDLQVNE